MAKKNDSRVVIQSFIPYRAEVNFRDEKGNVIFVNHRPKTVVVPSKESAPKNILILSVEDYQAVKQDLAEYVTMGQRGGVTILDDIPSGYWDPAQRVAEAEAKRQSAETERDAALTRAGAAEAEVVRLTEILTKTYGWTGK